MSARGSFVPRRIKWQPRVKRRDMSNHSRTISAMPNNKLAIRFPHRAAEVDLLRDRDHADTALAPVGQHVDALLEIAGQAVQLPHHNRVDLTGKDGGLQFLEGIAL
jgi:hypothetical protein